MIQELINRCDNCMLNECIGCEITNTEIKELEKEWQLLRIQVSACETTYQELENKIKDKLEICKKQYEFYNNPKRETRYLAKAYQILIDFFTDILEGK